jgi:hypothetical protein
VTLRLARGVVVSTDPLIVRVGDRDRPAWADPVLVEEAQEGDEVVVNTEALDLGLGSGGFDVVHLNLTRGLGDRPLPERHVMKLNYTSLQHSVDPVESGRVGTIRARIPGLPVLILPLHGHLAPAAWAAAQISPGLRLGYVQTPGGALPGSLSRDVAELRERGLLTCHVTSGATYGGEREAVTTIGALDAGLGELDWDVAVCGPGPGIVGSATEYGHGGMFALESAHAALARGMPTLLSPRLSSSDPRPRHRGLSHHTRTVLAHLLGSVRVPVPEIELEGWPTGELGPDEVDLPSVLDALHEVCDDRHDVVVQAIDLRGYAESGLPTGTMGRTIEEDPLFFAAPLAAGAALAEAVPVEG